MSMTIRPASVDDLDAINRIIEAAIMTWDLPERVKRLTLPTYKYNAMDLDHLEIVIAETDEGVVGVAAWEAADNVDAPANKTAMLLHGIYVDPGQHRKGIGARLFKAAELAVAQHRFDGVVVKAQKGSEPFYLAQGMHKLDVNDAKREYENRFWKSLN
ncbi:MAG: GNAT family N-acetyltransferase [Gammaproteobacteria bacterium]|nr:GNAT family N-acetyltransferase [Gammaproteobacteria bacterium]